MSTTLEENFVGFKDDTNEIVLLVSNKEEELGVTSPESGVSTVNSVRKKVGSIATLGTVSAVSSINEVQTSILEKPIGDLNDLDTSVQTDVVSAINEIVDLMGPINLPSNLTQKVNDIDAHNGNLSSLTTSEKTDTVSAINELDVKNNSASEFFENANIMFLSNPALKINDNNDITIAAGKGNINGFFYSWDEIQFNAPDFVYNTNALAYIYLNDADPVTPYILNSAPTWNSTNRQWQSGSRRCIGWFFVLNQWDRIVPFTGYFDGEEMEIWYGRNVWTSDTSVALQLGSYSSSPANLYLYNYNGYYIAPQTLITRFGVNIQITGGNPGAGGDMSVSVNHASWTGGAQGADVSVRVDNIRSNYTVNSFGTMWVPSIPGTNPSWSGVRNNGNPTASIFLRAAAFRV